MKMQIVAVKNQKMTRSHRFEIASKIIENTHRPNQGRTYPEN